MTLRMLTEQNREQAIYKIVNHPIPQYGADFLQNPWQQRQHKILSMEPTLQNLLMGIK